MALDANCDGPINMSHLAKLFAFPFRTKDPRKSYHNTRKVLVKPSIIVEAHARPKMYKPALNIRPRRCQVLSVTLKFKVHDLARYELFLAVSQPFLFKRLWICI